MAAAATSKKPDRCPDAESLSAYLSGSLSGPEFSTIDDHLEGCSSCQDRLTAADRSTDSLDECLRTLAPQTSPSDGPAALELGVIDQYQLTAVIGRGGMGVVYRARHRFLGHEVALKCLSPARDGNPQSRDRFLREIQAAAALDHPNIVRLTHAGQAPDGRLFLVMELLGGKDLAALVAHGGPLAPADACELARQACEGLAYAHGKGLVHRDIKPSNLVLTPEGTVKLLDFGLCRFSPVGAEGSSDLTQSGQIVGTADFIAPEQANDARSADPRSDLYSLGCTLFFLLTGRKPYDGPRYRTPLAKLVGHAKDPCAAVSGLRDDVPPGVEQLLHRLLAKDPAARPSSAAEVARLLAPLARAARVKQLAGLAKDSPRRAAAPARPRSSRRWVLACAAVFLPLSVLALWSLAGYLREVGPEQEAAQPASPGKLLSEWLTTTSVSPEIRKAMQEVLARPAAPG
jgi:hypothetical protein